MPTYHARSLTVHLSTASLITTTTSNPAYSQSPQATSHVEQSSEVFRKSSCEQILGEEDICEDESASHIRFLGLGRNMPFIMVHAGQKVMSTSHAGSVEKVAIRKMKATPSPTTSNTAEKSSSPGVFSTTQPQALCLTVSLNPSSFLSARPIPIQGFRQDPLDLEVLVYLDGFLASSTPISARYSKNPYSLHLTGTRFSRLVEKPWMILPPDLTSSKGAGIDRWTEISRSLRQEAALIKDDENGRETVSKEWLTSLASLDCPKALENVPKFSCLDVVIISGNSNKQIPGGQYATYPERMTNQDLQPGSQERGRKRRRDRRKPTSATPKTMPALSFLHDSSQTPVPPEAAHTSSQETSTSLAAPLERLSVDEDSSDRRRVRLRLNPPKRHDTFDEASPSKQSPMVALGPRNQVGCSKIVGIEDPFIRKSNRAYSDLTKDLPFISLNQEFEPQLHQEPPAESSPLSSLPSEDFDSNGFSPVHISTPLIHQAEGPHDEDQEQPRTDLDLIHGRQESPTSVFQQVQYGSGEPPVHNLSPLQTRASRQRRSLEHALQNATPLSHLQYPPSSSSTFGQQPQAQRPETQRRMLPPYQSLIMQSAGPTSQKRVPSSLPGHLNTPAQQPYATDQSSGNQMQVQPKSQSQAHAQAQSQPPTLNQPLQAPHSTPHLQPPHPQDPQGSITPLPTTSTSTAQNPQQPTSLSDPFSPLPRLSSDSAISLAPPGLVRNIPAVRSAWFYEKEIVFGCRFVVS